MKIILFQKRLYRWYDVIFQYRNLVGFIRIYGRTDPAVPDQGLDETEDIAEKNLFQGECCFAFEPVDLNKYYDWGIRLVVSSIFKKVFLLKFLSNNFLGK